MNFLRIAAAATLCAAASAPAWSAVDIGVGVTIRQPGVYGRIEIGTQPPPPVLYPQPVIIARPAVVVAEPPLYLYVPPGHARKWSKHCYKYNACGREVYFVREDWVRSEYAREHPGKNPPRYAPGRGRGDDQDEDRGRGHGRKDD